MLHVRICAGGAGPTGVPTATEFLGRFLISVALDEDVQYVAILVYCPP